MINIFCKFKQIARTLFNIEITILNFRIWIACFTCISENFLWIPDVRIPSFLPPTSSSFDSSPQSRQIITLSQTEANMKPYHNLSPFSTFRKSASIHSHIILEPALERCGRIALIWPSCLCYLFLFFFAILDDDFFTSGHRCRFRKLSSNRAGEQTIFSVIKNNGVLCNFCSFVSIDFLFDSFRGN